MQAYLLKSGDIAYPTTTIQKGVLIHTTEIAKPGSTEHKRWKPFAEEAPEGMFSDDDEDTKED